MSPLWGWVGAMSCHNLYTYRPLGLDVFSCHLVSNWYLGNSPLRIEKNFNGQAEASGYGKIQGVSKL